MKQTDILQALHNNSLERQKALEAQDLTRLIELQNVRIILLELLVTEQTKVAQI